MLHMSIMAIIMLILGTVSTQAQSYLINIRQIDGNQLSFVTSKVDSIWFDNVEPECVDLGLSVKWATFNIGASAPDDYGDYYAWGETSTKSSYTWENYRFKTSGDSYYTVKFSKYNTQSDRGTVDDKTTLEMIDDIARQKWGGSWRMPTTDEFAELLNNCTWTWSTYNGFKGYIITSNKSGYTDRSIFLPAAGFSNFTTLGAGEGEYGYYMSSSLNASNPYEACCLFFSSNNHKTAKDFRYYGQSVRPVCP